MTWERAELGAIVVLLPFFLWLKGCDRIEEKAAPASVPSASASVAATSPSFPLLGLDDDPWTTAAVYCDSLSAKERMRPGSPCIAEMTGAARACHVKRHCPDAKDAEEAAKAPITACEAPCVDILRGMINFYRSKTDQAE